MVIIISLSKLLLLRVSSSYRSVSFLIKKKLFPILSPRVGFFGLLFHGLVSSLVRLLNFLEKLAGLGLELLVPALPTLSVGHSISTSKARERASLSANTTHLVAFRELSCVEEIVFDIFHSTSLFALQQHILQQFHPLRLLVVMQTWHVADTIQVSDYLEGVPLIDKEGLSL